MTLEDWQTSTGQDLNSFQANPFEPAGPYLGAWQGAGSDTADLHFTSYPGSEYLAPNLGIVTDIDGNPRAGGTVIIGADEVPHHQADVTNWTSFEGRAHEHY